jgi:branched-chain amino acid transport system substrate-binding protein
MKKYMPDANLADFNYVYGFGAAQLMTMVLKACGDDLTRENVMKQATNLKDVVLDVALPGIKYSSSPSDYFMVKQLQLARFDGKRWALFGDVLSK